jgi:hypothetical protein
MKAIETYAEKMQAKANACLRQYPLWSVFLL